MIYYICAFLLAFLAISIAITILEFFARDARRPFPTEQKLLREAGHSLRHKLTELDRLLSRQLLGSVMGGLVSLMLLANGAMNTGPDATNATLTRMVFGLFVVMIILALYPVVSYVRRRRNLALGLLGERIVAEHLESLKASGHRVFHDVPADIPRTDANKSPVNIDHVVVGPAGVFAIETKTRRKGRARVGFMADEIIYDGRALAFPWGEDRHGLDQARRQAEWLADFLQRELGRAVPVQPLLVFPGWAVIRKDDAATNPVNVLSPSELPAAIGRPAASGHTGFAVPALDTAAIDLVARQLETRCRDIEL
jgi:hypothetical protein